MKYAIPLTILLIIVSLNPVYAITGYESPTKDASVLQNHPSTNYGSIPSLSIGYNDGWMLSLMEFDLSSYSGVTVDSATLGIYQYDRLGSAPDSILFRLVSSWEESTVTYSNKPGDNSDLSVTFGCLPGEGWLSIDLTDIVTSWVNGSFDNNGFIIGPIDETPGIAAFYSKEYTDDPNLRPYLEIVYTSTNVESASIGKIKTVFK